jgi:hypothetical protein
MTDKKKSKKRPKKKLELEKRPIDALQDDLPVEDREADDVQGGRAPPYSPVGPVAGGNN